MYLAKPHPARLVLVAVALPSAVALATYLVMGGLNKANTPAWQATIAFGLFVVEIGLVGVVVGHTLPQPAWRWLLYGWVMLLVDLLVGSQAMIASSGTFSQIIPAAALVAAQIGLAIVWGVLGTTRWQLRLPLTVGLGTSLLWFWISQVTGQSGQQIMQVLMLHTVVLFLFSAAMWARGYRLIIPQQGGRGSGRSLQFGIRDVLILTTVMAILLALMRSADMLHLEALQQHPSIFFISTVGLLSAIAIVFAAWAALGRGHWLLRYGLLTVVLLVLGGSLGAFCWYQSKVIPPGAWYFWDLYQWYDVGWWWIAWMFLSGGLLAATLVIFRAVGYRLVRMTRSTAILSAG